MLPLYWRSPRAPPPRASPRQRNLVRVEAEAARASTSTNELFSDRSSYAARECPRPHDIIAAPTVKNLLSTLTRHAHLFISSCRTFSLLHKSAMGNEQSGGGDGDGGGDGGSGSMNANAHGLPPLKELRAILGSEDVSGASNLEEIHGTLELKKYETAPMNKASLDFADDIYSQLDPYRKTEKHDILKRLYVAAVKNGDGMVSHGDAAFAALACCTSATSAHATGECLFHIIDVSVCSARALSLSLSLPPSR